jgi:hypothetical protein
MKTFAEMDKMVKVLKAEVKRLPQINAFGDSNEEPIAEIKEWIADLELAKQGLPPTDPYNEVKIWLQGDSTYSALRDYESA